VDVIFKHIEAVKKLLIININMTCYKIWFMLLEATFIASYFSAKCVYIFTVSLELRLHTFY